MKLVKTVALFAALLLVASTDALAQAPANGTATNADAGIVARFNGIGIGLVIIGAGLGIGRLAASAMEAMARQPEIAGTIQTAMIIAAALIEGATFFAIAILFVIRNT